MNYFEIKNGKTYYNKLDLEKLCKQFGTPTKVVFLDIVENQIKFLKQTLNKAIKKTKYNGKFLYFNANKANYAAEMVYTASKFCDGVETSSYYDLAYTKKMLDSFDELKDKTVFSNGFKPQDYCDEILRVHRSGVKIVDIIDSLSELDYLLSKNYKSPLEIGVRVNLEGLYGHKKEYDRFGLSFDELKILKQKLKNQNKLKLTTVHFHQRGFAFEEDKFYQNIEKACQKYCEFKKDFKDLNTLDIGGGTPWSYENDFNYDLWAEKLMKTLKNYFDKCGISHPNLVIENGKFTTKDSIINFYSVVGVKKTDPKFLWYVLNTSLMVALPEYYMCGEPMKVVPIGGNTKKMQKVKLAGITCDCDDVFSGENKTLLLPEACGNDLNVAIIGTGSYQESLTSQNAVRHCLVPAEKRIISFVKNGKREFLEACDVQTVKDVFELTKLNKKYLSQF